jgi:parallel beta-helix repeat protein
VTHDIHSTTIYLACILFCLVTPSLGLPAPRLSGENDVDTATSDMTDFFVSLNGDDMLGDGTIENPWRTIQHAIAMINAPATITLLPGNYVENVRINKSLELVGAYDAAVTLIASSNCSSALRICADNVTVHGISIVNAISPYAKPAGLVVERVQNCTLQNLTLSYNYNGVFLDHSANCTITNTSICNNTNAGIILSYAHHNCIKTSNIHANAHNGIELIGSDNNSILDTRIEDNALPCIDNANIWYAGLYMDGANRNLINHNSLIRNKYSGIHILRSNNNSMLGNYIAESRHGIYIQESTYPLYHSTDNLFVNNTICRTMHDVYDRYENTYTNNYFVDNLQASLMTCTELTQYVHVNDVISFSFTVTSINGTPNSEYDYTITLTPHEQLAVSRINQTIEGTFSVTRLGTYTLQMSITDSGQNTAQRYYLLFVNASGRTTTQYFIRGVAPTHGQPAGTDAKSLLFTPPNELETWQCAAWVQNSPDDVPDTYPFASIDSIETQSWIGFGGWKNRGSLFGFMGLQRYETFDYDVDINASIPAEEEYLWVVQEFTDIRWSMEYEWNWYWLALKLYGCGPHWMTKPEQPSYATITRLYTTTPAIEGVSSHTAQVLAATCQADDNTTAQILLAGNGYIELDLQMPNTKITYTVRLDGDDQNVGICSVMQTNGHIQICLNITEYSNEHVLEIACSTQSYLCGDTNGDGSINISDAVYLINYVFVSGSPAPTPFLCIGDANGDGTVNISDAVWIINYVFLGGPAPSERCCNK